LLHSRVPLQQWDLTLSFSEIPADAVKELSQPLLGRNQNSTEEGQVHDPNCMAVIRIRMRAFRVSHKYGDSNTQPTIRVKLDDSVRKLLDAQVFAFVASLNKDGYPQVTPV
jgi:hypothetical protein